MHLINYVPHSPWYKKYGKKGFENRFGLLSFCLSKIVLRGLKMSCVT